MTNNSFPPGKFFMLFCCLLGFFKFNFFEKFFQEYHLSGTHIGSRSGPTFLISVQSVCKGYEQMTLVGNELNGHFPIIPLLNCLFIIYIQQSIPPKQTALYRVTPIYLVPVSVDYHKYSIVSPLSVLKLFYSLVKFLFSPLPLLNSLSKFLVLKLKNFHVHLFLSNTKQNMLAFSVLCQNNIITVSRQAFNESINFHNVQNLMYNGSMIDSLPSSLATTMSSSNSVGPDLDPNHFQK